MLPKIFYNNQCSLCNIEINHYKKKCDTIKWIGIHDNLNSNKEINKTQKQLIRRLHLMINNEIFVGVDAFIYIWSKIPSYKFLSKIVKLPIIYHIAIVLYEIIAFFLYLKNYKQISKINKNDH